MCFIKDIDDGAWDNQRISGLSKLLDDMTFLIEGIENDVVWSKTYLDFRNG
ncbi:hypothetical protein DSLASN_02960 [Desulfoluna limicola]|uniref:Uncharacterized protein n=1 Tax=Desulfoluna limicola TaxID=2810562 RepID=A0ABM7PBY9_9BACT|nr:hypothetical protein DSLASN_02960 [Desulfoluna limicola]